MTESKSFTRFFPHIARYLVGLPLLAAGIVSFVHPAPPPPTMAEGAKAFLDALVKSGYMVHLIEITQVLVGLCLVFNRFVPLALALVAPFIVNSMGFHIFLERTGLIPATVFLLLELYLAWSYRAAFRPMLAAKVSPGAE